MATSTAERSVQILIHGMALLLVVGATVSSIVNQGLGWSPSPDLVSNQVYDATALRLLKHLVDNPQVKLPYLAYEGAVWLKSTTAAQLLLSLMSFYLGWILPRILKRTISKERFASVNRFLVLSTVPTLVCSVIIHIFISPIPAHARNAPVNHGDRTSGYLKRMLPAFLVGWSFHSANRHHRS